MRKALLLKLGSHCVRDAAIGVALLILMVGSADAQAVTTTPMPGSAGVVPYGANSFPPGGYPAYPATPGYVFPPGCVPPPPGYAPAPGCAPIPAGQSYVPGPPGAPAPYPNPSGYGSSAPTYQPPQGAYSQSGYGYPQSAPGYPPGAPMYSAPGYPPAPGSYPSAPSYYPPQGYVPGQPVAAPGSTPAASMMMNGQALGSQGAMGIPAAAQNFAPQPQSQLQPQQPSNNGLPPANGIPSQNLNGIMSQLTPQMINQALSALGISPNEGLMLSQQISSGALSLQEVQSLCTHMAAASINPSMIQNLASAMGLSATMIQQVQSCMPGASGQVPGTPGSPTTPPGPQPSYGVSPVSYAALTQPSLIEQSYGQLDLQLPPPNPSPLNLSQFGYSIFASMVSTFAPVGNVPVGPDYVIGPNDQLNLYMWGRLNQVVQLVVDRDGSVEVPGIEPLQIGGLTFSQAKKLIEGRLRQLAEANAYVTMGQLRTLQVLVVGAVNQPGSYAIGAMSRVSAALIAAGGVAKIGSLRRVELRRGNQVKRSIDFYKMLLHGDNSEDEFLQTNDVIFVSPIGPVVGVIGDVQRPAIYELTEGTDDLRGGIRLAAGTTPFSNSERVQVMRVDKQHRLVALDVSYGDIAGKRFKLRDGDLVRVFHILTQHQDVVWLTGNVRRPGEFQWRKGLRVSDVIKAAGGVAEHTYFKYARLQRLEYPSMRQRFLQIDLGKALNSGPDDPADLVLLPRDEVDVFNEDLLQQAPTASISGEVQLPGTFALSPNMRLSDLIYMAGGFNDDAYRNGIELVRTEVVDGKTRHTNMNIDYKEAASDGRADSDPVLQKNDQVYVNVATDWHAPWSVQVSGEVMRPGTYPIDRYDHLSDLIRRCGGFTRDAFPRGVVFVRQSVVLIENTMLAQARLQLSQGLGQYAMMGPILGSGSSANASMNAAAMLNMQNLLVQAQNQQANGRVVVRMGDSIDQLALSTDNMLLENGDTLTIPRRPSAVQILGQVNQPTSRSAEPGWTVWDYLSSAGGATPYADTGNILVVKADGSVITDQALQKAHTFPLVSVVGGGLMSLRLEAGDTIYVPSDVQSFIKTQYAMDITQIVANAAQSLAIIGLLGTKL